MKSLVKYIYMPIIMFIALIFILALSQPQPAFASALERKLTDLQNALFEFEIDTMYHEVDKGYAQIVYKKTTIVSAKSERIAVASPPEEFRIVSVQPHYYEIEFELQGRMWRGYVPISSVRRQRLSADARTEFKRYLSLNGIEYYKPSGKYVTTALVEATTKILQGQALINEGRALVKSGQTATSVRPIEIDNRFSRNRATTLGQAKIKEGESKIAEGEKMVKEGKELEEEAREKQERVFKELALEIEQAMLDAFDEDDFIAVMEYGIMAKLLELDIVETSDYEEAAKKAIFYLSELEHEADMAFLAKDYRKAIEKYSQALTIVEDSDRLKLKLEKAKQAVDQTESETPEKAAAEEPIPAEPPPEKQGAELVDFKGNKVDAERLKTIQKGLKRVYGVDSNLTKESLAKLLQPDEAIGSIVNWELSITGYKPETKKSGIYTSDDVEFEWDRPPRGLSQGAKVKVIGELKDIENRKVGKKYKKFYIIEPDKVLFEDDPDYVYY